MSKHYSEDDVITIVANLTRPRLVAFVEAEVVAPLHLQGGLAFRPVDLARLELLCDLAECFDLDIDALGLVMSLIDQLHGARADLACIMAAVAAEPEDVRARIGDALRQERQTPGEA